MLNKQFFFREKNICIVTKNISHKILINKKRGEKSNLIIVEKLSTYLNISKVIQVKTVININNMNPLTRYTEVLLLWCYLKRSRIPAIRKHQTADKEESILQNNCLVIFKNLYDHKKPLRKDWSQAEDPRRPDRSLQWVTLDWILEQKRDINGKTDET